MSFNQYGCELTGCEFIKSNMCSNLGQIFISSDDFFDEIISIDAVSIVDLLESDLLNQIVTLPNGVSITARQYIQEVYAPYIPSDGVVHLKDGANISVKQFIESILLNEGQSKYNGDIGEILMNTTRNNDGTVLINPNQIQEQLNEIKSDIENRTKKEII